MELTLISQKVDFCGHFEKIWVWSVHQKYAELAVRGNKTKAMLRRASGGVISILLTPPRLLLPSPSRVPRSERRLQEVWFAGDPPSEFRSAFTRVAARWGRSVPRGPRGRVGPRRRARRQLAGSRVAASFSEWVVTPGRRGWAADLHSARPATLKPVPRTAPWRPRRHLRHHAGDSSYVTTLPGVFTRYWLSVKRGADL